MHAAVRRGDLVELVDEAREHVRPEVHATVVSKGPRNRNQTPLTVQVEVLTLASMNVASL